MNIKRIIDGKEYRFELTAAEMREAYEEQQDIYRQEDIEHVFSDMIEAEDIDDDEREYIENNKSIVFSNYRRFLENNDFWYGLGRDAINVSLNDYEFEKQLQEGKA